MRIENLFSVFFIKLIFALLVAMLNIDKIQGEHPSYKYSFSLKKFYYNLNKIKNRIFYV